MGGAGGNSGSSGTLAGKGSSDAGGGTITTSLMGTLGALGSVKPTMAGWAFTYGQETILYFSSAPLSCAQIMTQGAKWLATLPAGTQVVEVVVGNPALPRMYTIGGTASRGGSEVNYAEGSKSSMTEERGTAGTVTFTKATPKGIQEGMLNVTAPFTLTGTFHAEWCEGGAEF